MHTPAIKNLTKGEFFTKLDQFCRVVEEQMNADTDQRHGPGLNTSAREKGRRGYHQIEYDTAGKRFVRVFDRGESQRLVRYFVEIETGVIFGAKGWKAYNPIHEYGNLDTINDWNWGGYYAASKNGKKSMVPKEARR
jgi:hypothetical protein